MPSIAPNAAVPGSSAASPVPRFWVGIDWGHETHQVCVVTGPDTTVLDQAFGTSAEALGTLVAALDALSPGDRGALAIAVEVPRGPVVERLLLEGFPVYGLNPKQTDRLRDRWSVAGAKDDRRDAWVVAQGLRSEAAAFQPLTVEPEAVVLLREWTRTDAELRTEENRLANRLLELLGRYYPALLSVAPAADEPWLWTLLAKAPTPESGRRLRRTTIKSVLATHRIRRVTVDEVHAALQGLALQVAPGTVAAMAAHVALLLPRLHLVHAQRKQCLAAIEALLAPLAGPPAPPNDPPARAGAGPPAAAAGPEAPGPSDAAIVLSQPGVGPRVAGVLLAEAPRALAARALPVLRALTGVAPVTKQSGKTRLVQMRRACNRGLRLACTFWATGSLRTDAASKAYYAALRMRGHDHQRALRSVATRLLRILVACLTTRTLYDPNRFALNVEAHA